ncbi:Hypothetical predicted protein [Paramuricea clavata]|uniref:Uncharacterized protein n=1 Tax=Paramuricea clavata TaxID=317549 RepID=A0A6S7I4S5_PARCT|nr:Hypothetical predicted protein [Paramuricea clavata]
MEVFQKKFVEEAALLGKGFTMSVEEQHERKFKLVVNGQVADLVAKAPSVNFILHNGKFGCCSCLHPGERMPGRGTKRVYPYSPNTFPRRTHNDTLLHAQLANDTRETIFGVKGLSIVHTILNIPDMLLFDYMHQVLEGEFTRRMTKWLAGSCGSGVNLKPSVVSLSQNLKAIGLPHDFNRKLRPLEEFKRWKASEKQTFFLHASLPLLKGILPPEIFYHHCLLVTGVRLLCEYDITDDQVTIAKAMLLSYTRMLPDLYCLFEATFNSHALTHLAEQVRGHGPLILHSAFIFESMLAHLKRLFHGTRGIPDQICKKLAVAQHAEHSVSKALEGNANTKEFADKLLNSNRLTDMIKLSDNVSFFGPLQPLSVPVDEIQDFPLEAENMAIAQRMTKHGEVYHSTSYARRKNAVSFLVKIKEDNEEYFGKVNFFVKQRNTGFAVVEVYRSLQYNICQNGLPEANDPILKEFCSSGYLGCHFVAVEKTTQLKFINCSWIVSKIVLVKSKEDNVHGFVSSVLKCYQHD